MHHTVTDEQIKAANHYLKMVSGASLSAAEMNQLATHLQYAPPQLSGDVIETAAEAAWQRARKQNGWAGIHDKWAEVEEAFKQQWREISADVAGIVLDIVCSPFTKEENNSIWRTDDMDFANKILSHRRDSLLKPAEPTMEEEITAILKEHAGHAWGLSSPRCTQALLDLIARRAGASHDR